MGFSNFYISPKSDHQPLWQPISVYQRYLRCHIPHIDHSNRRHLRHFLTLESLEQFSRIELAWVIFWISGRWATIPRGCVASGCYSTIEQRLSSDQKLIWQQVLECKWRVPQYQGSKCLIPRVTSLIRQSIHSI